MTLKSAISAPKITSLPVIIRDKGSAKQNEEKMRVKAGNQRGAGVRSHSLMTHE